MFELQSIMLRKSDYPGRRQAQAVAENFGRVIEYDPGKNFHHFIYRYATAFSKIRTFTPSGSRAIKFKYGPLKKEW